MFEQRKTECKLKCQDLINLIRLRQSVTSASLIINRTKTRHSPINPSHPQHWILSPLRTIMLCAPFVTRSTVTSNFRGQHPLFFFVRYYL